VFEFRTISFILVFKVNARIEKAKKEEAEAVQREKETRAREEEVILIPLMWCITIWESSVTSDSGGCIGNYSFFSVFRDMK
jgi:hypothetical protein